jgi:hypothetical protein
VILKPPANRGLEVTCRALHPIRGSGYEIFSVATVRSSYDINERLQVRA